MERCEVIAAAEPNQPFVVQDTPRGQDHVARGKNRIELKVRGGCS